MGKPILYNGSETDFNHLGLGVMHNTTSALVTEERNGSFVLDVVYQLDDNDLVGKEIKVGNLIKADAGHKLKNQRFRIKRITRAMNNQIKIYAEHISYLSYDLQINNHASVTGTGDIAIKGWKQAIMGTVNPFTVSSDIQTDTTTIWTLEEQQNARLALGGSKGSLLDLWGGEFQFDNYDIKLLAQRGKVADTIIAYGRNLEEFEDETDITDVFTSIRPFVKYTDEKTKQEKYIFASPEIIDHANASKFPNKKVFVYDMSSEFDMSAGKLPTPANIATKATAYMKANDFGVPKTTMKLSYVDLSKTLDYTQYKALEEVNLCDMIPIHYEKLGVTGNAKITKVVWNVLADSYDSLELGQPARSLAQRFAQIEKTAKESGKQASYALGVALTAGDQQVFYGDTEPPASTVGLVDGAIWYKQHGTNGVEMYTWDSNTATWIYVIGENDGANLEAQLTAEIQKRDVQIGAIDQVAQDAKSQAQNVANQIALIDASARNLMSGSSFNAVTSTGVWEYPLTIPIKANTDYSFGGMMNPDKNVNMKIEIVPASGSTGTGFTLGTPVTLPNGVNTRVGVSGKSTTAIPKAIVRFTPTDLTAKTAHSESMLTESTIPQDWQPAPEDIQKGIYGLQQDLTKAQTDITNAKTALDNLEIGGRNYLRDSASPYIKPYLNATSTVKNDVVVAEWKASDAVEYTFSGGTSNIFGTLNNTNVVPKVPYTDDEKSLIPLRNYIHSIYIKNLSTHPIGITNNNGVTTTIAANETRRLVMKTYKAGSSIANLQFVFQNASGVIGVDHHFIVWHAQVELGTAVTDWKASPMDAEVSFKITNDSIATKVSQTTFNTLKGTVDGHTTQLTQTADAIKLKADKDSVDTLTQRVTKNESDIDLNTDAIKLKVNQTDYDALAKTVGQHTTTINQTSSQIGLMATKTELNTKANQTDFAALQVSVGQISTKVSQHDGKFSTITQDVDKIETRIVGATGLLKDPEMADATIKPSFGATSGITVAHESTGWRVKNTGTATARAFWSYSSSGTGQMYEQVNANQTYSGRLVMQVPTAMVGKEFTFQIGDGNLSIKPTSTAATVYEFVTHPSTSGAVSVWLPIAGECVIREITVRELNTDITTAKVSKMTQDINGLTVTVGTKASTADLKVQTDRITTVVSQTNKADWYAQAADGFGLTLDPYFDKSTNSFQLYDYDASVDNVKMSRQQVTSAGTMPTWPQHKYRMVFTATDAILIGTRGSNGGWSTPMQSRANAIFLVRFTALLPSGNNFQNGSNSIGTNGSRTWLTSQAGTGNWTDYAYLVKCGNAGTFSTFGFQYVTGSKDPTAAAPLTWYVSKYDIIDVTESFQNSVSSQITQLSDSINLRVSKNDVVNQINVSTEGIKIDGTKVHITGSTLIDNAVIKDAMIADLKTSKLTADTINASVMSLIKINANQLIAGTIDAARIAAKSITADKLAANAIQVGFNAVGSTLKLDYDSLDIYKDGKKRMALESNGMTFWEENGTTKMGTIGTNSLATKPNVRGLVTDLDFPTEYAAWAYQKTISGLYTTMLVLDPRGTYGADGFSGVRVDTALRVMGETQLLDGVQPNGAATATINFTTSTFNGNNYSALQQENNKSGVIFGNYLYLLHNGVVYSFEDVKKVVWALLGMGKISIPTNINSSGVVTTWKNATV